MNTRTSSGAPRALWGFSLKFTDRKSTRLNSSHSQISYAVFCLKKKKNFEYLFTNEFSKSNDPFEEMLTMRNQIEQELEQFVGCSFSLSNSFSLLIYYIFTVHNT